MAIANTPSDPTHTLAAAPDADEPLDSEAPQSHRLRWLILLCGLLAGLIVGLLTYNQAAAAPAEALGSCAPAYLRQIDRADSSAAPALPALGVDITSLGAEPQAEATGTDCAIR
jgi:hypothetical protein